MALACIHGGKECDGCGDCRNRRRPHCPICSAELNYDSLIHYYDGRIVGCEYCIDSKRAEDVFPDD
jgi:hypothetical protein